MSDKPREFWFSRKRVDIGASPVQTDYYNTRFYPQEEFERERSRNVKLREALEFYSKRENFTLIFDNENDSRAEVYEKYKKYSIGDFSVRAIEALAETEGKA